jgi:hypothetical protein
MKKIYVLFSMLALITLFSCKKESSESAAAKTPDNKALVNEIFKAGMTGYAHAAKSARAEEGSYPVEQSVDWTEQGPAGGTIHVVGDITGNMNFNDNSGDFLGGLIALNMTETINDYAFAYDGETYTMNGAPYISMTGTFTLVPGMLFGTASSIQFGGGVRTTGPGYDHTSNIQITIIINSNGSGGTVSGTIDGQAVNYTF